MQTVKLSCARTGSAVGREAGFWRAPPKGRPGPADRVPAPTPRGCPWRPPDARHARARFFARDSRPPQRDRSSVRMPRARGSGLARLSWFLLHGSKIPRMPGTSSWFGQRTTCHTVTASLAVLGWVEVAHVGFQRHFDLLQDIPLLQGQPAYPYVAQPTQEQVRYLQPQRHFGWRDHQHFLDRRDSILVFLHLIHPSLCRVRLRPVRLAIGERRPGRAQDAKAPEKRAHGHERPGDEAWEASPEHRHPEQGAARRGGDRVLV